MNWEPIAHFTGKFDGNGKKILHLTINRSNEINSGLFGIISGAEIQNLGLEDVSVTVNFIGDALVGALVGQSFGSTIANVYATGDVNGGSTRDIIGGLVGRVSAQGIMNGTGNDLFSPKGETTRAQAAAVLLRAFGALGWID
jgi:pyruvate/2-oxoglutarate dehydrogenase complex dihydrolipoamide dehydrogenase (E3) component